MQNEFLLGNLNKNQISQWFQKPFVPIDNYVLFDVPDLNKTKTSFATLHLYFADRRF